MRERRWIVVLALMCCPGPPAVGQSGLEKPGNQAYVPQLGDLMDTAQARHTKLWFAGKAGNWELAAYELNRLKTGLVEAALLYSGIPVSNVTTLQGPLKSVSDAIDAGDSRRFIKSFADLTDGCNSCHRSMTRSFIVIRTPTETPFGNQLFPPQGAK